MNLALHRPSDISDASNLEIVATCFVFGDGQDGTEAAIVKFDYVNEGDYAQLRGTGIPTPATPYTVLATVGEVGSVGGLAYQRDLETHFAGSFMKRHSGFGPGGPGAIYEVPENGGSPSVFATLPNAADPHPTSTIGDPTYTADWDVDANSFDPVGKIGLGDMDLSEDSKTLYALNHFDRQLYEVPLGAAATPLDLSSHNPADIVGYDYLTIILNDDPNALGINPNQNIRPSGLGVQDGFVYIGMVNTAQYDAAGVEGNLATSDLSAYVYRFDPANPTAVPDKVLEFSLDYQRHAIIDASFEPYTPGNWNPWVSAWPAGLDTSGEVGFAQPLLTDIEFDNDGSMILGFRDRFGDQGGYNQAPEGGVAGANVTVDSGGDTLRADYNAGSNTWTIESDLVYPHTPFPASTDLSIEFYDQDTYGDAAFGAVVHNETTQGSLAFVPGYPGSCYHGNGPDRRSLLLRWLLVV